MSLDDCKSQQNRQKTRGKLQKRNHGIQSTHIIITTIALALFLMWAGNILAIQSLTEDKPIIKGSKPLRTKSVLEPQHVVVDSQIIQKEHTHEKKMPEPPNLVADKLVQIHLNRPDNRQQSPYSYAWVLGAIHEDKWAYKGFLWDIIISANLLRKQGSTADFWVFVRLSPESKLDDLPSEDRRLLEAVGVNIKVLDKPEKESFAQLVFDKFLTINMTDYKRVMFLDGDLIPLLNLDYIFHLSDPDHADTPTLIKPNLITASLSEPCNTGMFMVEPSVESFAKYNDAVLKRRESAKTLPYPYFDYLEGWGRNFKNHNENWRSVKTKSNGWHFHASHSDQGLMLYWSKYLVQEVTIVISDIVENWKPGLDGDPVRESEVKGLFAPYQGKPLVHQWSCEKPYDERKGGETRNDWRCFPPINSVAHFMGKTKPWKQKLRGGDFANLLDYSYRQRAAKNLWFLELQEINTKYQMGIDLENWDNTYPELMKNDTLGVQAMFSDQGDVLGVTKSELQSGSGKTQEIADTMKHSNVTFSAENSKSNAPVVAYAVSFIKCGDHQNTAAGLIDASLVLRHSIHKISSRNPESGSKYDYKMYAIVHTQAQACSQILEKSGFKVIVVDPPFDKSEIKGDFLRTHIHKERCCGHDEFIKLHAYNLPEDVIVHVDIDFALYKPMDILFDAILHEKDSPTGQAARQTLQLERPGEALPDKIGAFLTRDWPQVVPGKWPAGYQAGFLVARRDPSIANEMVAVIKEGNYTEGWGYGHGWGNKGYAGWVGAMAMQGLVAYYYDHIRPGNAVELNHCRYNHMGMDVRHKGKCRNGSNTCEDCMQTKMEDIYSMHYTMCRKPWLCQAVGSPGGKKVGGGRGSALNTNSVNVDHCLEMAQQWHTLRSDLEASLLELTDDEAIREGASGKYKPDVFQGHCDGDGEEHYLKIAGNGVERIQELYLKA